MFKPPGNPRIEELTKSHKERSIDLGKLRAVPNLEGKRFCVWCNQNQLHHGNQKYCDQECAKSAMAWAYPQKEEGLFCLMIRQNWKCNLCPYSWEPQARDIHAKMYKGYENFSGAPEFGKKFDWGLIKRLKGSCQKDRRPEVDHIVPIYKGGQSLGLDNHQAICYSCHKSKTGKDLSGKRAK